MTCSPSSAARTAGTAAAQRSAMTTPGAPDCPPSEACIPMAQQPPSYLTRGGHHHDITWSLQAGLLSRQTGIAAQGSVGAGASATGGVPAATCTTSALTPRAWAPCQPTQVAVSSTAPLGGSAPDLVLNETGPSSASLAQAAAICKNRDGLASMQMRMGQMEI